MSVKNKKKNPILEPKNLIVTSIAAIFVILIAVSMSMMLPKDNKNDSFDESAWQSAVSEAESSAEKKNDADSSAVSKSYGEKAVAAATETVPKNAEEQPSAETVAEQDSSANTQTDSSSPSAATAPNTVRLVPPIAGAVTADYSADELVYSETMGDWRTHNGIDFGAAEGTDVLASAAGTVEAVTDSGMMGTTVIVLHDGGIRTIYSNLAENEHVSAGDAVTQGAVIGKVGRTAAAESAEAPHLHFEMSLNEETVNPHDYLPEMTETE